MKHLEADQGSKLAVAIARGVYDLAELSVESRLGERPPCCVAQLTVAIASALILRVRKDNPELFQEIRGMAEAAIGGEQ